MVEASTSTSVPQPKQVVYCQVCSFPAEYCEFSSSLTRCKAWLQESHPSLYAKYYSADALSSKMGTLSVEAEEKIEADAAKREAKAEKKAAREAEQKKQAKVTIIREERTKRKVTTHVQGLEAFGIDLKKAAKQFAQKFATGSSVTKSPQGNDEIVVQGDVTDEVQEMLEERTKELKNVPQGVKIMKEDKKKKKKDAEGAEGAAGAPAA